MQNKIERQEYNKDLMTLIGKPLEMVHPKLNLTETMYSLIAFTILRRIDCFIGHYAEEMSKKYIEVSHLPEETISTEMSKASRNVLFYNISGLNLAEVVSHPDKVDFYLLSYIDGFNKEVKDLLEMLDVKSLIARLKYEKILFEVINYFAGIDLGLSVTSLDICNVFRHALEKRMEFTTPELYCYYAQAMIFDKEIKSNIIKIYDPVCGVGNLLNAVTFKAYSLYEGNKVSMYGQDINRFDLAIMSACALIIGDKPSNIRLGNVIAEDMHEDKRFEYIVADLPLGISWRNYANEIYNESFDGRFSMGVPKHDSQLLFIQHIISKMSPNGSRAVIITNSNPLSAGDTNDSYIRKCILERDLLEAIITLPKLPGLNIQKYMWVLSNNKGLNKKGYVRLIDTNLMAASNEKLATDNMALLNNLKQIYDLECTELYSKNVSIKELGCYQISVKDKYVDKIIKIEVPLTEDTNIFLEKRGISKSNSERFEILYDKTIDLYRIDMEKFFSTEDEHVSSEKILEDVKEAFMSLFSFEHHIDTLPNLKISTDYHIVDEGVFKKVPSHWQGVFLRDAVICRNGKKYKDESLETKTFPIYSISSLRLDEAPSSYTDDKSAIMMNDNDVVIISRGSNAGEILCGKDGALGQNMILVTPQKTIIHEDYLYYLMSALNLKSKASGVAIKGINIHDIESTFVCLPPLAEQEKMVEYLYSLESSAAGVYEKLGTIIPIFELYWNSIRNEIITGKYDFR